MTNPTPTTPISSLIGEEITTRLLGVPVSIYVFEYKGGFRLSADVQVEGTDHMAHVDCAPSTAWADALNALSGHGDPMRWPAFGEGAQ